MNRIYYHKPTNQLLDYSQACDLWIKEEGLADSPLIMSRVSDEQLALKNIHRVYFKYDTQSIDKDLLPYQSFEDPVSLDPSRLILVESDNPKAIYYYYPLKSFTSNVLLEQSWDKVRQLRNALLAEYDWAEKSDVVDAASKKKIAAYKELLRDLPSLFQYPHQVVFPKKPSISKTENKKVKNSYYTEEKVNELLNTCSTETVQYWISLGKPLDKKTVNNIIAIYN